MNRKFQKEEIDLIYELLRPDEEVLWKGKPKMIPNVTVLTTLGLVFLVTLFFGILVVINKMEYWFVITLFGLDLAILFYIIHYSYQYYEEIKPLFYVVTNTRLAIFNTEENRITFYKRYPMIKVLRIKKSVLNSASIIFEVSYDGDEMKETGFVSVVDADKVMRIINKQMYHTRL